MLENNGKDVSMYLNEFVTKGIRGLVCQMKCVNGKCLDYNKEVLKVFGMGKVDFCDGIRNAVECTNCPDRKFRTNPKMCLLSIYANKYWYNLKL